MADVITAPGVYDLDAAVYHADPCPAPSLSSSIGKVLVGRTARHAWMIHPRLNPDYRTRTAENFDLGSAYHAEYLGAGKSIVRIEAKDWRTDAAKNARDAARADGLIPLLGSQHDRTVRMVAAVRPQVAAHPDAGPAFADGKAEQTLIWREDNGVWCRAMLDWIPATGDAFPDLKWTETDAGPDGWGRTVMFNTGCDFQDAFYRRGLRALGIRRDPYLLFVVAEEAEPHLIATHRMLPATAAMADRKVESAIELFGACLARNRWPGHRAHTAFHDVPPWLERQWLEREMAIDYEIRGEEE